MIDTCQAVAARVKNEGLKRESSATLQPSAFSLITFSLQPKSLFIFLLPLFTLLCGTMANAAETQKKEEPPEIRRTATIQRYGGEKLLHSPLSLALDAKNGDLIITSFGSGEVVILDKNGALIKRMGPEAGLISPYGVAIDDMGRIYVSEIQTGMLKVFSPGGILEDKIDLSRAVGRPVSPGRITLDKDDRIYVADLRNNEILVLNHRGDFVKSMGNFDYLQKAVVVNDKILGLSAHGTAVSLFNQEGVLLSAFGKHGDESARNFSFPTGFAVDSKNRIWIADAFQHRLKVFSLDGELLFNFGRMQEKTGGFFFPVDLCFGDKGKLFVLEKGADRIQVFQVGDLDE